MAVVPGLLVFVLMAFLVVLLIKILERGVSNIKLMLLGISIMLFGGILAVAPNSNLGGFEYIIVCLGLCFSLIGFGRKD